MRARLAAAAFCAVWVPFAACAQAGPGGGAAPPGGAYDARVTRVFDGDTLWVKPLQGGRYRKLRLEGIDAPEICQPGGVVARDALAARVLNQVVEVRVRHHDDYGRWLARVHHQGDDVGAWMVAQGQAWSYRWRNSRGPFEDEEALARQTRKGLFAQASAELPRTFRQRHGPCALP